MKEFFDKVIYHITKDDIQTTVFMMANNGIGMSAYYFYHDDAENIYFSNISVLENYRNKGVGTLFLNLMTIRAGMNNFKKIYLSVNQCSWMHYWYLKNGFKDYDYNKDKDGEIWMIKELSNNKK